MKCKSGRIVIKAKRHARRNMLKSSGKGNGLGTVDKPVLVTKDNVLNFISTALLLNRANYEDTYC